MPRGSDAAVDHPPDENVAVSPKLANNTESEALPESQKDGSSTDNAPPRESGDDPTDTEEANTSAPLDHDRSTEPSNEKESCPPDNGSNPDTGAESQDVQPQDGEEPVEEPEKVTEKSEGDKDEAEKANGESLPNDQSSIVLESDGNDTNGRRSRSVSARRSRRRNSIALSRGSLDGGSNVMKPGKVHILNAMQRILASKDAKRTPVLAQTAQRAVEQFENNTEELPPAYLVLEPLRIVCTQGTHTDLKVTALECIAQLFSFSYLNEDTDDEEALLKSGAVPLLTQAVDMVCDVYDADATDARIELHIVRALHAALCNEELPIHGPLMLKAVRQIYNVFVISRSKSNQTIAQVALTQASGAIFGRIKTRLRTSSNTQLAETSSESNITTDEPLTLSQIQNAPHGSIEEDEEAITDQTEHEREVQDAFLLFRTLCKLSEKTDVAVNEVKSHGMRSKLFSLHLLHLTLKTHISVFSAKNLIVRFRNRGVRFAYAIKDYLCSTLSHNATSISPAIFEISAEIFWLVLSNLRSEFKREIEVFFKEVYFTIMEMRTASPHQKQFFLVLVARICNDPRALVELYLNYDCDPQASNVFENLIGLVVRLAVMPIPQLSAQQLDAWEIDRNKNISVYNLSQPPSAAMDQLLITGGRPQENRDYPFEYAMRISALEALVGVLRSLLLWSQRGSLEAQQPKIELSVPEKPDDDNSSDQDNPGQFETRKSNKKALDNAIAEFNFKPSRGVDIMLTSGLISERSPKEVARILLTTDGFDKKKIGEFLGGRDDFERQAMHHFVGAMDFGNLTFVQALRQCLQRFRLPGEGQVVDRYMLEFATKFHQDNPTVFTNATTPYVLAYSVVMLNTELHSPSIGSRKRMSLEDFIANNQGINDGLSLPDQFLREIYDEIANAEIVIESEHQDAAIKQQPEPVSSGSWLRGSSGTHEAYLQASEIIVTKTAQLFKSLDRQHEEIYYNASHIEHVRPMFEVAWMSMLAGLSRGYQAPQSEAEVDLALEGMGLALRIACHFDIELARVSFIQTLVKFASLPHVTQLQQKNIAAVKILLRVVLTEGEMLKDSWYDVLLVVSQLERVQLIVQGVDPALIPDISTLWLNSSVPDVGYVPGDVVEAVTSRELVVACDQLLTQTAKLSPLAMVDFVKALARVAMEEIEVSQGAPEPRTSALQKMVDVAHYNMARIRMEWRQIWKEMGEKFNAILTHSNERVVAFALDSLRQLSLRFLDLEELPHFKFQKDFLESFQYVINYNQSSRIKALALECLRQMIVTKGSQLRSGWTAIFATIEIAAQQPHADVIELGFSVIDLIYRDYIDYIVSNEVFAEMLDAICVLASQAVSPKVALHSVEILHHLCTPEKPVTLWHLVFRRMHRVIMEGQDLEVRERCLRNLFTVMTEQGGRFERVDWDRIFREDLFPMFAVLREPSPDNDDLSLWLSSTLIQALRSIVSLFASYFAMLEHELDHFFLELLKTCICQENDAVSRVGNECLQELIKTNTTRFTTEHWHIITTKLVELFKETLATELMDQEILEHPKPEAFRSTIAKTIQSLLITDTVRELIHVPEIFANIPVPDILRLTTRLRISYSFARDFNRDHALRVELYHRGVVPQTPNLLLQEKKTSQAYISVSMRLFREKSRFENDPQARTDIADELIPICKQIVNDYNSLSPSDHRYVKMLTPLVESVLSHFCAFADDDFSDHIGELYLEVIEILNKDMTKELRECVQKVLRRVADVQLINNK